MSFFGFRDRAHAASKIKPSVMEAIESKKPEKRQMRVCTRGRGHASTLPYLDDGVTVSANGTRLRFAYSDGGPPDDGLLMTTLTYVYDGNSYSWSEFT